MVQAPGVPPGGGGGTLFVAGGGPAGGRFAGRAVRRELFHHRLKLLLLFRCQFRPDALVDLFHFLRIFGRHWSRFRGSVPGLRR